MKKDNNINENIVLDEQNKENEQSQKELHYSKVKRIVLAVLLLILAVAFVVLGAFCATGLFDRVSAPANVAYADCIVDDAGVDDSIFNVNARNYFGDEMYNKTPNFNAFVINASFFSWFDDWGVPNCNRQSFFTFYRASDDKRVADLLLTRNGVYSGGLILRMFADDKQTSYSSYDMFSFSDVVEDGYVVDMSVRTFANTYCFGYGADDVVYGKLNDDVVNEVWVLEFTEMMWLCCDVTNESKINQLQSNINYWELNYNALRDNYNKLDDEYSDLVKDYNNLEFDYQVYAESFTCVPHYYYASNDCWVVGERIKIPIHQEGVVVCLLKCPYASDMSWYTTNGKLDVNKMLSLDMCSNFGYLDFVHYYEDLNYGVDEFVGGYKWGDSNGVYDGYTYVAIFDGLEFYVCTDVKLADSTLNDMLIDYYNDGLQDGKDEVIDNTDTITNGIIDVIESPIEFLKTIFNFEIFGINISSVIFFVISILIVAFVIRKVV